MPDTRTEVHEARKIVTVVFADVVASTELGERLDPEALRQVVTRYFDEMAAVLEAHGGTVEKFIGDAVMAVFGIPAVHEDDALRAVRAAATMHARLRTLNEELAATWGATLTMRIGINTGEVVAGDPAAGHGFVSGAAVNIAKRLEEAAEPGQILLGDATHRLVQHAVSTTSVGPISLRGKRETETPRRLEEVRDEAEALARRLDAPLVGRRGELARLQAAYAEAVAERRAHLVTLLGAPGIGKSRLAKELLDGVAAEATTLVGRCLPYGEGITFWPVRQILPDLSLETTNEEIFLRIRRRLEELARERPLVVCFDDIHWAEPTFLDLVQYLAGWIRDAPVLILCLGRSELLEQRPDWLTPASEGADTLALGALKEGAARELLAALDVPEETRARIAAAAEGNPLFVEQMAAMALEQGEDFTVPPSIRALLAARLDRLGPEEAAVVEAAAVVGRDFSLRAVLDLLADELRSSASTLLLTLVRKELVRPHPVEEDGFRFRHALIRDAAYDSLPKRLRADLHRRHAAWLEREDADGTLVALHLERSVHLFDELGGAHAERAGLAARAARLLGTAGQRAARRSDVPAARNLLGRAVALLPEGDAHRGELEHDLANALWAAGEIDAADALLERVVAAAAGNGAEALEWFARVDRAQRRGLADPDGAAEFARTARRALEVFTRLGEEAGLARVRRGLGVAALRRGAFGEAAAEAELALAHAERAGDETEAARTTDLLCTALLYGPAEAREAARRCHALLHRVRDSPLLTAHVSSSLAGLVAMQGELGRARVLYGRAKELYGELGLRMQSAGLTQVSGWVELLAQEPAAAERELREGQAVFVEAGAGAYVAPQAALLALALLAQGREEEAAELVELAERSTPESDLRTRVVVYTARARLEHRRGEPVAARRAAETAVALGGETDALNLIADALVALADASEAAGDAAEARRARARARALYLEKGNLVAAGLADLRGVPAAPGSGNPAPDGLSVGADTREGR